MDDPITNIADPIVAGDTIVALSTAPGTGAIGIVRLSGPEAAAIADRVLRPAEGTSFATGRSHVLRYGHVVEPSTGRVLDEALAVVMRPPSTYTREEVVEIQCHGGPAAQRAVLRALTHTGARPAEPGEFTRRAFLNGRIDLAQAESVAAIVQARSASALRAAVRQLEGGLGDRISAARGRLIGVLAALEAGIDFSDEDIDDVDRGSLDAELGDIAAQLEALLATAFLGRALREGVRTAIVGRPNVGKSSLLNALVMRERAIVSEIPGTTRDTVEEIVEVGGIPLHLVDTAGLRPSDDHVERLGIERSRRALVEADLVLAVFDVGAVSGSGQLPAEDEELLSELDAARTILVGNKLDTVEHPPGASVEVLPQAGPGWTRCAVSALSGEGLDELRLIIERLIAGDGGFQLEEPLLATERQRLLVEGSLAAVREASEGIRAQAGLACGSTDELICEDVRRAAQILGRITGADLVDDLLDDIFRRFCIGK